MLKEIKVMLKNIIKGIGACEHIEKLIDVEKQATLVRKAWFEKNRKGNLLALRKRHELNIQLEQKAGISKPLYKSGLNSTQRLNLPETPEIYYPSLLS